MRNVSRPILIFKSWSVATLAVAVGSLALHGCGTQLRKLGSRISNVASLDTYVSVTSATPSSPSNLTTNPVLSGSVIGPVATMKFYDNVFCAGLIGSGSNVDMNMGGIPITVTPNTMTSVYAMGFDAAGTPITACDWVMNWVHDSVDPVLALTSPTNSSYINAANVTAGAISGTCTEDGRTVTFGGSITGSTTCAGGSFSVPYDFSSIPDGGVSISVVQTDAAGNAGVASVGVTKDVVAPTTPSISINGGAATTTSTAAALTLSAGGASEMYVTDTAGCASGGAWEVYGVAKAWTLPTANAVNTVYAKYRDAAGNETACVNDSITHDNSAPTVAFTSPAAASVVNAAGDNALVLAGTCSENGRTVSISGSATSSATCTAGAWSATVDVSGAADGALTFYADHVDAATNAAPQASLGLVKDATLPTVAVTAPAAGSSIHTGNVAAFTLSGTCSENTRTVSIGGAATASATCTAGAWSATLDLTAVAEGAVSFTFDHSDAAGNTATQASRSFTKDTGVPTVAFSTPAAGSSINASNAAAFTVTGTCSENTRTVSVSGAVVASATCTAGAWSATLDVSAVADGAVTLYADLTDAAGNSASQASRAFVKDVGIPTLAITSPANGSVASAANAASFTVSGTCSEDTRNVVLTGSISATAVCTTGAWTHTYDFSAIADGSLTVTANHGDSVGNAAPSVTHTYTKDTALPTVAFSSPAAGAYANAGNVATFAVSGTCSENGRNVAISGAASATIACAAGAWSTSFDLSALADGAFTLYADHSDASANSATQASRAFNKDVGVPTLSILTPANASTISAGTAASFTVSGACSENTRNVVFSGSVSGNEACAAGAWSKTFDLSALPDGTITVTVNHGDLAGNAAPSVTHTYTKDTGIPTVAFSSPAAGTYANVGNVATFAVSGTCSENGRNVVLSGAASATVACAAGAWSTSLDLSALADGAFTLYADHSDASANAATQASRAFVKDASVPTVAITAPAGGTIIHAGNVSSFTVSGTCSEDTRTVTISGAVSTTATCSSGTWSKALDFSAVADGSVTVNVAHTDVAGNSALMDSETYTKDAAVPTVAITAPASGSFVNSLNMAAFTVSGTCSENTRTVTLGGTVAASATCTAGAWSYTYDYSAYPNGAITVTADHEDAAGNDATQASRSFTKSIGAGGTDSIVIAGGALYATSTSVTLTLSSDNYTTEMYVTNTAGCASGGAWETYATSKAWTLSQTNGTATVYAQFKDGAGNLSPCVSDTITHDNTVPTLAFTSPAAGTYANIANASAFAIAGTCSDNGRTVTISGGGSASFTCTAGAFSGNVDVSGTADGAFTLYADMTDVAGNAATQASRAFNKDVGASTVAITAPASGSFVLAGNQSAFTVSGTCSENTRTVNITATGMTATTATCTAGAWSKSLDLSGSSDGAITVGVTHDDVAGNASSDSEAYSKDTGVPTIAITSPAANSYANLANYTAFTVSGTCSEAGRTVSLSGALTTSTTCSGGNTWSIALDLTAVADGAFTLNANHSDSSGNAATQSSRSFIKDAGASTVAITAPATGSFVLPGNQSTFTVSGTCSENTRTVNITATGMTATTATCTAGAWSKSLDLSSSSDGTITVGVTHDDVAGNASSDSETYTKDTSVPTIAITSPAANSYANLASYTTFTVSGTCSEAGRAVSLSGALTASTTCSGGNTWSLALDLTAVADGAFTINVDHADASGNSATQASRSFNKDIVPPSATSISIAAGATHTTTTSVTLTLAATAATQMYVTNTAGCAAGGAWETYGTSKAWTLSQTEGTATVYANYRDAAGNESGCINDTITHDATLPTIAITSPAAGSPINVGNQTAFTISGTCSENGRTVTISGGASATTTCTAGAFSIAVDASGAADGTVTMNADLSDAAGNAATQATRNFVKDTAAPTVAITSPSDGAWINSSNKAAWTASGTCSENTRAVEVKFDGAVQGTPTCTTGTWTLTIDLTAKADGGPYTLLATHIDANGNAATDSSTHSKDVVLPSAPTNLAWDNGTTGNSLTQGFSWTGTASADSSTNAYYSMHDGGTCSGGALYSSNITHSTGTISASYAFATQGTKSFLARAIDQAGNTNEVCSAAFVIDTSAPTGESISIAGGATTTTTASVTLTLAATGATQMYVTNTAGCGSGGAWETYGTSKAWTLGQTNATATVYVKYRDAATNESTCVSDTIIHDNTLPTVAITSPAANSYINIANVASVTVSGTCSEAGRNVVLSGAASATITCAGDNTWSQSLDFSGAAQGTIALNANHSDAAGNAATQASRNFIKDTVKPNITLGAPFFTGGHTVMVGSAKTVSWGSANDSGSGVASISILYKNSAGVWTTVSSGETNDGSYTWTVPNDVHSSAKIQVMIYDNAGNTETDTGGLFTIVPAVSAPTSLSWTQTSPNPSTSLTANWTKNSSAGLASQKIQFYSDGTCGTASGSAIALTNAVQTYAWTAPAVGIYSFKVFSVDIDGNEPPSACSSAMTVSIKFYFGLNLGGDTVARTVNGNLWTNTSAAITSPGVTFQTPYAHSTRTSDSGGTPIVSNPTAPDTDTQEALRHCSWGGSAGAPLGFTIPVTNGSYHAYIWTRENFQSNFRAFDAAIEGTTVAKDLLKNATVGNWHRYGPFPVAVSDAGMTFMFTATAGEPTVGGIELYSIYDVTSTNVQADNFDNNSLDTAFWSQWDPAQLVVEQNQRAEYAIAANQYAYGGVGMYTELNLTNRSLSVQVPVTTTASNTETIFEMGDNWNAGSRAIFSIYSNNLNMSLRTGGVDNWTSVAFSAVNHAYLRIRHEPVTDRIYWETSPNGISWTVRRSVARNFDITRTYIQMGCGAWAAVATPGGCAFDNYRVFNN